MFRPGSDPPQKIFKPQRVIFMVNAVGRRKKCSPINNLLYAALCITEPTVTAVGFVVA
jgi:hypothetical protein